MHNLLLFSLIIINFSCITCIVLEVLPYNDPKKCNSSEIYNVNLIKCQICDSRKFLIPSQNKNECVCNENSIPKYDASKLSNLQCEKCNHNSIYSVQTNKCIKCTHGTIKIDNKTYCKPCKDNEIILHHFTNGTALHQTLCLPCTGGMIPSNDGTKCVKCPIINPVQINGTMKCICDYKSVLLGNVCIAKHTFQELTNDKNKYYFQYNNEIIESALYDRFLKENIFLCKLHNTTACQFLANLCTLTLYTMYENSPCNLWLESRVSINPESLNVNPLPWLFYRDGEANIILNRKKISAQYNLNPSNPNSKINLTAVVFNLNGTFKEVKSMRGSFLNLCPDLDYVKDEGLRFGVNYQYDCEVEAKQFFYGKVTEFFEPYLQYWENGKYFLSAIPVFVRNLSQNKYSDDPSYWQLVRRFFIFDSVSSIGLKSNKPTKFRYIKSIQLRIKLRDDEESGQIFPPLLMLEYGEISQEKFKNNEKINFQFSSRYELKNNIKHSIEISIGVLSSLAVIYSGIQTWSHSKRIGKITIDLWTLLRICIFACGNLANVFFIVVFGASVYTFLFFKGQSVLHLLLPVKEEENIVKNYIIAAFFLKIVEISVLIWNQISIDIFLIDWERPRPQDTLPRPKSTSPFTLSSSNNQQSVSIWRSYFIANEWNEIQTTRKINLLFHIFTITFLLKVIGLENWATFEPEIYTNIPKHLRNNSFNFICKFAVGNLVYVFAYVLQLIFMMTIYERYIKNSIQQFVDVCSLANISVFIMSLERYGFYIHGRSSHGFADTDMATMLKQLQREEEDLCAHRGLLPGTHHQTFSVGVPLKLRLYYNKLMLPTRVNTIGNKLHLPEFSPSRNLESTTQLENFDKRFAAYQNMKKFLSAFLEHALKELDYDVRDKQFVESLLDIEFTDCFDRGIFYKDNGHSFDNVLFYGNEFSLFFFDIILFSFISMFVDDFIIIIITTFCILEIIKIIRRIGGKHNLAGKTLIDAKFLI